MGQAVRRHNRGLEMASHIFNPKEYPETGYPAVGLSPVLQSTQNGHRTVISWENLCIPHYRGSGFTVHRTIPAPASKGIVDRSSSTITMKLHHFPLAFLSFRLITAKSFQLPEDVTASSSLVKPINLAVNPPDAPAKRVEHVARERTIITRTPLSKRAAGGRSAHGHETQHETTVHPETVGQERTEPRLLWSTDSLTNYYTRHPVHGLSMNPLTATREERIRDAEQHRNWPNHTCDVLGSIGCERANVQIAHLPGASYRGRSVPYAKVTELEPWHKGSDEVHIHDDGTVHRKRPSPWSRKGYMQWKEEREWKKKHRGEEDLTIPDVAVEARLNASRVPGPFFPLHRGEDYYVDFSAFD